MADHHVDMVAQERLSAATAVLNSITEVLYGVSEKGWHSGMVDIEAIQCQRKRSGT